MQVSFEAKLGEALNSLLLSPVRSSGKREIELRFGSFVASKGRSAFKSEVEWAHYDRLRRHLELLPGVKPQREFTQVEFFHKSDLRKIGQQWQLKSRAGQVDLPEFGCRLAMAFEEDVSPPAQPPASAGFRRKQRTSFALEGGAVRVDLTEVEEEESENSPGLKAEVEMEWTSASAPDARFTRAAIQVFKFLRGSLEVYSETRRLVMVGEVNRVLKAADGPTINPGAPVEARNLKLADVVYGGLVGGEHVYNVTHKTDGVRKLLIVHKTGTWLAYPPYEFNLIDSKIVSDQIHVLDGEYVPQEKMRGVHARSKRLHFFAFDCLVSQGSAKIQERPHTERMKAAQTVVNRLRDSALLDAQTKSFLTLESPEAFFSKMRRMLAERENLPYEEDGLIFTPSNAVYNPRTRDVVSPATGRLLAPNERVLSSYPDVCKWKPASKMTIDFALGREQGAGGDSALPPVTSLLSWDYQRRKLVPFYGTAAHPFDPATMLSQSGDVDISRVPNGKVIEYAWDPSRKVFYPHRLRPDKPKPNRQGVAIEVWGDIHEPIEESTLTGDDLVLMRRYHNRAKKNLFSLLRPGATLLDIGSGRGGDLSKWKRLGKVVAVEPNEDNLAEFRRRLQQQPDREAKVDIVVTGGEDTASIIEAVRRLPAKRADAVSLMFSLTFFWRDSKMLDSLVETILHCLKPGGRVIFATADGDAVSELFSPVLGGVVTDRVVLGTPPVLSMELQGVPPIGQGRKLLLDMPGTIVGKQEEYLARLGDLLLRLRPYGFRLTEFQRLEKERFLNPSEKIFTHLMVSGVFAHDGSTPLPGEGPAKADKKAEAKPQPGASRAAQIIVPPPPTGSKHRPVAPLIDVTPVPWSPMAGSPVAPASSPKQDFSLPALPGQRETKEKFVPLPNAPLPIVRAKTFAFEKEVLPEGPLGPLPVSACGSGDDTYGPLQHSMAGVGSMVRIATLPGPHAFFHALLKAFYAPYQETSKLGERNQIAAALRRDLAALLGKKEGKETIWETVSAGIFPLLYLEQVAKPGSHIFSYSLAGLQGLLNSSTPLPAEIFSYVADALDIDVYLFRATARSVDPSFTTAQDGRERWGVALLQTEGHYETIGLSAKRGFQTVFGYKDSLLRIARAHYSVPAPAIPLAQTFAQRLRELGAEKIAAEVQVRGGSEDPMLRLIQAARVSTSANSPRAFRVTSPRRVQAKESRESKKKA